MCLHFNVYMWLYVWMNICIFLVLYYLVSYFCHRSFLNMPSQYDCPKRFDGEFAVFHISSLWILMILGYLGLFEEIFYFPTSLSHHTWGCFFFFFSRCLESKSKAIFVGFWEHIIENIMNLYDTWPYGWFGFKHSTCWKNPSWSPGQIGGLLQWDPPEDLGGLGEEKTGSTLTWKIWWDMKDHVVYGM